MSSHHHSLRLFIFAFSVFSSGFGAADYYDQETATWEPTSYLSLGAECDPADDDCGANMECRKTTHCPGDYPICQCAPGFVEDRTNNHCQKLVGLGQRCRASNLTCEPSNSFCNEQENQCQCRPDYKLGPLGNDCVWTWKTLFYGQKCRRSIQCHYNMSCENYACTCPLGSRVDSKTNALCLINGLDNTCSTDDDCFRRNSVCRDFRCVCQDNYDALYLRFATTDAPEQEVCVYEHVPKRNIGENCSTSYPFDDGVCQPGLVCSTQCSGGTVCVDPTDNRARPTTTRPTTKPRIVSYGDRCETDMDCETQDESLVCKRQWLNACQPVRSSGQATSGVCRCADGFFLNGTFNCSPKPPGVYLGQECVLYQTNDVVGNCLADGAVCSENICICKLGYKPGPRGDDCVSNWKTQFLGEECHDSIQCHYNMLCVNGTCSCTGVGLPGQPIADGSDMIVECARVNAGDRCKQDSDCSGVNNAACSPFSKRCQCNQGFVATALHYNSEDDKTRWCLPEGMQLRQEGEECNFHQPLPASFTRNEIGPFEATMACAPDFYCSKCVESGDNKGKSICVRRSDTIVVGRRTTTPSVIVVEAATTTIMIRPRSPTTQTTTIYPTLKTRMRSSTTTTPGHLVMLTNINNEEGEATTYSYYNQQNGYMAVDSGLRKMQQIRAESTRPRVSCWIFVTFPIVLNMIL